MVLPGTLFPTPGRGVFECWVGGVPEDPESLGPAEYASGVSSRRVRGVLLSKTHRLSNFDLLLLPMWLFV